MPRKILTGKFTGISVFFIIMLTIFHLTFNIIGKVLSQGLSALINLLVYRLSCFLLSSGVNYAFHGLIIDGICSGIGSVLSFVPTICVLFFFLGLLSECGYLDEVSALFDAPMKKVGLNGKSTVPLIMGFGCAVPAIMTADAILDKRKKLRIFPLIPFMSCSAKLPVYAMLISIFFNEHRVLALAAIYITGIFSALLYSIYMNIISPMPQICNFPSPPCKGNTKISHLRRPALKPALKSSLSNGAAFIKKAFTIIFMASVIIWFLQSFDSNMNMVSDSSQSLLAQMGKALSPVFAPLGFDNWRAASAIIAGIFAKEAIVSTFAVLSGCQSCISLPLMIQETFSPASALSFMIFCLLYIPCTATIAALRSCGCSRRYTLGMVVIQLIIAWSMSFLIFNIFTMLSTLC